MKFVGGEALIFTKFFKGEWNFSQSSEVKRKGKSSTSGGFGGGWVRILKINTIVH